jgi:zinc protease
MSPPSGDLRRARLDNGLVVVACRRPGARSVAVRLAFEAGSAFDPAGKAGLASMMARLLDRGAGELTAGMISERFEFLGVAYVARARRDSLDLEARLLAEHLREVLGRLRLLASEPTFPETELKREQGKTLTAISERDQDTAEAAEEALAATLFPEGHPYHAPALGTRESVESLARSDLLSAHRRRIGPSGAVLAIAGGIDPDRAVDVSAEAFGSWPAAGAGERRTVIADPPLPARRVVLAKPLEGKTQADIALGILPGVRRLSPDLPAAMVMNCCLGEFGLGGRLGREVREKSGLAYYAHSYFAAGLGRGPLVIRAGVAPRAVGRAVGLLRRTIEGVRRRGLRAAEIRDARQSLAAAAPRRLETNPGSASFLAECEFHGLGVDYASRLPGLYRAVTQREVMTAAREYLDLDRHVLVVSGPAIETRSLG